MNGTLLKFDTEADKKGYYNVEKIKILNTIITNTTGQVLTMLRSGNDESTMGPSLIFSNNQLTNSNTAAGTIPLIQLAGSQKTIIDNNLFQHCNKGKTLIEYKDEVRAVHLYGNNKLNSSGIVAPDKFVNFTIGNKK